MAARSEAQSPQRLVERLERSWQYLDCRGWNASDCVRTCGYASAESGEIDCIGSPRALERAVAAMRPRWDDVERWLIEELTGSSDADKLDRASQAALYAGRGSPAFVDSVAANFRLTPVQNAGLLLERDARAHGARDWILGVAMGERRGEHLVVRVLRAALESEHAVPPGLIPLLARRHHELLPLAPVAPVLAAARARWPAITNLSEQESLAAALGLVARKHPTQHDALIGIFDDDVNAEMFYASSGVHAEDESPPSDALVAAYLRTFAAPNTRRAFERANGHPTFLCALHPAAFTDATFVEGTLRLLNRNAYWTRSCEPAEAKARWAAWIVAHRQSEIVDPNMFRDALERLGFDVLVHFDIVASIGGARGRRRALEHWCRALGAERDDTRAHRAIESVVSVSAGLDRNAWRKVLFCADQDRTHVEDWAVGFTSIVPRLHAEALDGLLVWLGDLPRRASPAARRRLLGAVRTRVSAVAEGRDPEGREGTRITHLSFEWAAMNHTVARLAAVLRAVDQTDLSNAAGRLRALGYVLGPFLRRQEQGESQTLAAELDAALALIDNPSADLRALISEAQRELARYRPLVL